MVELNNVSKYFSGEKVLSDFSCRIGDSGLTIISGPSGSGKTTLARIISGIDEDFSGERITDRELKVTYIFQEDRLISGLSALENVSLVSDRNTAEKILKSFGLDGNLDKKPDQLSGGMKRRTAVARALAYGGDLLVADEPFKGLDSELKSVVYDALISFSKKHAVILISHDREDIEKADNVICLT